MRRNARHSGATLPLLVLQKLVIHDFHISPTSQPLTEHDADLIRLTEHRSTHQRAGSPGSTPAALASGGRLSIDACPAISEPRLRSYHRSPGTLSDVKVMAATGADREELRRKIVRGFAKWIGDKATVEISFVDDLPRTAR